MLLVDPFGGVEAALFSNLFPVRFAALVVGRHMVVDVMRVPGSVRVPRPVPKRRLSPVGQIFRHQTRSLIIIMIREAYAVNLILPLQDLGDGAVLG